MYADRGLGQDTASTDWLDSLSNIAKSVEQLGTGAKSIQTVLAKKPGATTTTPVVVTGAAQPVTNTILGMPSWLVYAGAGILVLGVGAFFLLGKKR